MRCCINQIAAHRPDEATPKDSFYCFNFLTQRGKADIALTCPFCPLMTHNGHCIPVQVFQNAKRLIPTHASEREWRLSEGALS
jgi:hypothetical protein